MMRTGDIKRQTRETDVAVHISIEGQGKTDIDTGIGFFDHMLDAFARFGLFDLNVLCKGDLQVDAHHTVEDVGIVLGEALLTAVGDKQGMVRSSYAMVPMDESLAVVALDFCGRSCLHFDVPFRGERLGGMDTQLCEEFFSALCRHAGLTLHITVPYGQNDHHKMEAVFKAVGKALDGATQQDVRIRGIHSTKGSLEA